MKHFVIAAVLVIIVTILVIMGLEAMDLVPTLASEEGTLVDQMFRVQLWFIAFFFSLIVVLVLYSVVVFRRRPGDTGDGVYVKGNTTLEIDVGGIGILPGITLSGSNAIMLVYLTGPADSV